MSTTVEKSVQTKEERIVNLIEKAQALIIDGSPLLRGVYIDPAWGDATPEEEIIYAEWEDAEDGTFSVKFTVEGLRLAEIFDDGTIVMPDAEGDLCKIQLFTLQPLIQTALATRYFVVTGRVCGDDEDSCLCFEAQTRGEAESYFERDMQEDRGVEGEKVEIFVNHVLSSDSPITLH